MRGMWESMDVVLISLSFKNCLMAKKDSQFIRHILGAVQLIMAIREQLYIKKVISYFPEKVKHILNSH